MFDVVPGIGGRPAGAATTPRVCVVPGIGGRPFTETGAVPVVESALPRTPPTALPITAPLPLGAIPPFVTTGERPGCIPEALSGAATLRVVAAGLPRVEVGMAGRPVPGDTAGRAGTARVAVAFGRTAVCAGAGFAGATLTGVAGFVVVVFAGGLV